MLTETEHKGRSTGGYRLRANRKEDLRERQRDVEREEGREEGIEWSRGRWFDGSKNIPDFSLHKDPNEE